MFSIVGCWLAAGWLLAGWLAVLALLAASLPWLGGSAGWLAAGAEGAWSGVGKLVLAGELQQTNPDLHKTPN